MLDASDPRSLQPGVTTHWELGRPGPMSAMAIYRQLSVRALIQCKLSKNFAATVSAMNVPTKQQRAVISGFAQGFRA